METPPDDPRVARLLVNKVRLDADPRAYTDRLNALLSPQGWTREYKVETMSNITCVKKGESVLSGKVLVTCTVTIFGLWSHSGTVSPVQ
jgi:hypothetical protein